MEITIMIQKIGLNLNAKSTQHKNTKSQNTNTELQYNPNTNIKIPSSQLLHSYFVSFGGKKQNDIDADGFEERVVHKSSPLRGKNKMSELENNVSYYGQKLLNDSRQLAKKYFSTWRKWVRILCKAHPAQDACQSPEGGSAYALQTLVTSDEAADSGAGGIRYRYPGEPAIPGHGEGGAGRSSAIHHRRHRAGKSSAAAGHQRPGNRRRRGGRGPSKAGAGGQG